MLSKTQAKAELRKLKIPFTEEQTKKELNELLEKGKENLKAFADEEKSVTEKIQDITEVKEEEVVIIAGRRQASIIECLNQMNGKRFDGKEEGKE